MAFPFLPTAKPTAQPGTGTLYLGLLSDFSSIGEAPATGTAAGETVIITDDHTFGAGKGFLKFPITRKGTNTKSSTEGDPGMLVDKASVEIEILGLTEATLELIKAGKNLPWIALVKEGDCDTDKVLQIGCECHPAYLTASFDSGVRTGTAPKKVTMTISSDCGLFFYEGDITEKP